jgi:hypothetical protein
MHMVIHSTCTVLCTPGTDDGRGAVDFRSAQRSAWEDKVAGGFNLTDVPLEFCLLQGEVAEAFESWRKGRVEVGEELANAAIYLLSLATMTGVDLAEELEAKLARARHSAPRCA